VNCSSFTVEPNNDNNDDAQQDQDGLAARACDPPVKKKQNCLDAIAACSFFTNDEHVNQRFCTPTFNRNTSVQELEGIFPTNVPAHKQCQHQQ
jgi:hypothetical protein